MRLPRVAVICDYREELWPSMDLVGEMLYERLARGYTDTLEAQRIRPAMRRRFAPGEKASGRLFNTDRLLNRFYDYPRTMRSIRDRFDLFHIVDHSYSQLAHELPAERTVITCHDLDTFRCQLRDGATDRRSFLFRGMTARIMKGLRRAARVTCDSAATRDELLAHELVEPERAVVVPNGVHPSCSPDPDARADLEAARLLDQAREAHDKQEARDVHDERDAQVARDARGAGRVDLLHVGSTVPRKRIDVLLRVFAAVRREFPRARLIRVGGPLTDEQQGLAARLGIERAILVLPFIERDVLAAVYRRAAIVLQPSEREGFGLPVVEALACGTPVVATDLPVLREVGGEAAVYCPVGDLESWVKALTGLLAERERRSQSWTNRRAAAIAQAAQFSWAQYADRMVALYRELL